MKQNLIAIAVDRNMLPAAAFLASRLASLNPRDDVEIAILSGAQDELEKARDFGVPAKLIPAKLPIDMIGQPTARITVASFLRLFIPDFIHDDFRRIIYLDADIYPENDSLFRLFDLDMGSFSVAAVGDIRLIHTTKKAYLDEELARARVASNGYLNGGMLLIDRTKFEKAKVGQRAFKLAAKNHLRVDLALNRVLAGKWLHLSPAMNAPMDFYEVLQSNGCSPALAHFIGDTKPWHGPRFAVDHPARAEIEAYILKSPWRDFLSKHYGFQTAWDAIRSQQGGATFAAPPKPTTFALPATFKPEDLTEYLRSTKFADVEQGITTFLTN